jgi:hypothetical protein
METNLIDYIKSDFFRITNTTLALSEKGEKGDYVLILLDGLDEIVDDSNRDEVLKQISELRAYSSVKVVLTSRSNDYLEQNNFIKDTFDTYELMPLTVNDIVNIGSKIIGVPTQLEGFIKLVKHSELIRSFPKTPLTAILLAILFKEERLNIKELPKSITELYSKFVDVFLNRWDKGKGISEQFLIREKEFVLQKIAEHLHVNGMVTISESELTAFLDNLFKDRSIETYSSSQQFLEGVQARTSLLIRDEFDNSYRFFHLTIQEYLSIALLEREGEDMLVKNFLNDWWLNANIFYAGKKSHSFSVLDRISRFEIYPVDIDTRLSYVINTSKVLQAAHLLNNESRRRTLESMVKIFDQVVSDLIEAIIIIDDTKQRKRTILDIILWVRGIFMEFFSSTQFRQPLAEIGEAILRNELAVTDITSYCIFYNLAIGTKNSDFLYRFLVEYKDINPRWYRIIDVDTKIKRLVISDKKMQSKIESKAIRNGAYIYKQFREVLKKHYSSVTGFRDSGLIE